MGILWTAVPGIVIAAMTMREIFKDLFHPSASGSLSDYIGRTLFRLFRRWPSILPLAGPLSLVVVILCWALLIAIGFALIYWGVFPGEFQVQTGKDPSEEHGFWSVLYFSLEVLTTLGLGDFTPKPAWLRILVTLHALTGYALITASLSWIVLLYPALGRVRSLARWGSTLAEAERRTGINVVSGDAQYLLGDLANDVIRARVDLIHFPIIYYFHSNQNEASLSRSVPYLVRFAEEGSQSGCSARVQLAAATLRVALDDLAKVLSERFVSADASDPAAVFRAYAEDHISAE